MTVGRLVARHRSWLCYVRMDPGAPGAGPLCLELVWRISGMVPRVMLCGHLVPDGSRAALEVSAPPPGADLVDGPSGYQYTSGFDPEWLPTADAAAEIALGPHRASRLLITGGGVDLDSTPRIVGRATDLLARLLVGLSEGDWDEERLQGTLADRVSAWDA